MKFDLKAPCGNCPFRKVGAIELRPGRVEGIIEVLKDDDWQTFPCHKTTTSSGKPAGAEQACMGAIAYLFKQGYVSVLVRLALRAGKITMAEINAVHHQIRDDIKCSDTN